MVYRTFEHTADLGIEVEAANLNWAFAEAALGLTTVITGGKLAEPFLLCSKGESFELSAPDPETLLVRWLSELLYLFDSENYLVGGAKTRVRPPTISTDPSEADLGLWRLECRLLGQPYERERHGYGSEVKAITYHELVVEEGPPARIRVLLDL